MKSFWLVQRLSNRDPILTDRGFDGFFSLEYMGSAEFEFSTPSASLKSMRTRKLEITPADVNGKTVFFIGEKQMVADKLDEFREWISKADDAYARPRRSKEKTYFDEALNGTMPEFQQTVAWWSFDDDIAWTLDFETAQKLLEAFATKAIR